MEQCLPIVQNVDSQTQRVALGVPLAAQGVACQVRIIAARALLLVPSSSNTRDADRNVGFER